MKPITLTKEIKDTLMANFEKHINNMKSYDEVFDIAENMFNTKDNYALVLYTPEAFVKMNTLVQTQSEEVAWRGKIKRGAFPNHFIVEDIYVYPQTVTPAFVDTDENEFCKFLYDLYEEHADEEDFCINFQGHSHVRMNVFPSGTDIKDQKTTMTDQNEGFFVFTIRNKLGEFNYFIYDYDNNIFYDKNDVEEDILLANGAFLSDFEFDSSNKIKNKKKVEEEKKEQATVKKVDTTPATFDEWKDRYGKFETEANWRNKND